MNPLHAIYSSIYAESPEKPEENFGVEFQYPTKESSDFGALTFQSLVSWNEGAHKLVVDTAVVGVSFQYWDGLELLLDSLNREITPFVEVADGGALRAGQYAPDEDLVPIFQFRLICQTTDEESVVATFFKMLYRRAAQALLLSRPIFKYVEATGHEPDTWERMRLLSIEHGLFQVALKPRESGTEIPSMLPRGFFLYLKGGQFHAPSHARPH